MCVSLELHCCKVSQCTVTIIALSASLKLFPGTTCSLIELLCIKLSASLNNNWLGSSATLASNSLNGINNIHAINSLSENNMSPIQPGGIHGADEELGSVLVLHDVLDCVIEQIVEEQ